MTATAARPDTLSDKASGYYTCTATHNPGMTQRIPENPSQKPNNPSPLRARKQTVDPRAFSGNRSMYAFINFARYRLFGPWTPVCQTDLSQQRKDWKVTLSIITRGWPRLNKKLADH